MTADKSTGRILQALPWLWLAMSLAWAIVIIVTEHLAWPLALWIATTVAPLTYLRSSKSESNGPDTKGNQ
jgi:hypothetical protein